MSEEDTKVTICLLGDVVQHIFLKPKITEKGKDAPYVAFRQKTGAALLQKMIYNAVSDKNKEKADTPSNIAVIPDYNTFDDRHGPELISILDHFPRKSHEKEGSDKRLRVKDDYYAEKVLLGSITGTALESMLNLFIDSAGKITNDTGAKKILVIYDRDSRFRKLIEGNYEKEYLKKFVGEVSQTVIAIRDKIDGAWLKCLEKTLSTAGSLERENCTVILTADALRKCKLNITENGTIEQDVREVVSTLKSMANTNATKMP